MFNVNDSRIGIIGLGYVGLPLAVAFGQMLPTTGFDINTARINELREGLDSTREVNLEELGGCRHLQFTNKPKDLNNCNVFIVTVPTPVDRHKRPDLSPLESATRLIANSLKKGDVVIYESTVYPGATEEICVPILEAGSGLSLNQGFFVGYSPERINPGDKEHRITNIRKVTSGSTPEAARFIDELYQSIIKAGTHCASSIRVAEAAKVIENTQRDVNIALINELAILFYRLGIDTHEVLAAAGTKWNFLAFQPGLVGGHCIGVDPYYLTHKAQEIGYHPAMILAGRRINDGMGAYIAERVLKLMTQNKRHMVDARILILGLTFKENCPDIRNTRVIDIIKTLDEFNALVDIHDPMVDPEESMREYGIRPISSPETGIYDAVILAVPHDLFLKQGTNYVRAFGHDKAVIFDVKSVLPAESVDGRL
ncbi:nucleotide sugar dehydrogenase [Acidihalobacter prosperus]